MIRPRGSHKCLQNTNLRFYEFHKGNLWKQQSYIVELWRKSYLLSARRQWDNPNPNYYARPFPLIVKVRISPLEVTSGKATPRGTSRRQSRLQVSPSTFP